jgi:hypothetical protein
LEINAADLNRSAAFSLLRKKLSQPRPYRRRDLLHQLFFPLIIKFDRVAKVRVVEERRGLAQVFRLSHVARNDVRMLTGLFSTV